MVSLSIAVALLSFQGGSGPNLVENAGLSRGWEGWTPVWSRAEGAAKAEVVPGRSGGSKAVHVVHTGSDDWSVAQTALIKVHAGDMFRLSGWMKCSRGEGVLSTVARDAKGEALDWSLGAVGPKGTGWEFVKRKLVVPPNGQTLQFRIIGSRPGETWVEEPSLVRLEGISLGNVKPITLRGGGTELRIESNGGMNVSLGNAVWRFGALPAGLIVKGLTSRKAGQGEIHLLSLANDLELIETVTLDAKTGEIDLRWQGNGAFEGRIPALGPIASRTGQSVVMPMNEGILFPVNEQSVQGWEVITYGGHGLCMPWSGLMDTTTGAGLMEIVRTPDDADVRYVSADGTLSFQPQWEPSRGAFGYERALKLCFFEKGGYVAMAKRYRAYSKGIGLFKTLATKRKENPNVDRLIGAVNVWNWDMPKAALCREMKQMGFNKVLWSSAGSASELREIAALGYLPGIYDIYQDIWDPKNSLPWQPTQGWPEDLVLESNGQWMKGWAHPDKQPDGTTKWYQGGVICSSRGLERARKKIPEDLSKNPFLARFIDTTTASPFRECYNPAHPLTRSQDRANKMKLLEFCSKDMKQVTGTETGIDPSVPVVHYYEGMMSLGPYRLPDSGTDMIAYRKPTPEFLKYQVGSFYRIPLWELVYHDCTVAGWYWGDATNKAPEVWTQRDLLNILYGTPPLLMFDKEHWGKDKMRMLQTYRNVCEWVQKVGYDEMISHEYLTPDHRVQKTTWSSGRSVVVNFGDKSYGKVRPMSFELSDLAKPSLRNK